MKNKNKTAVSVGQDLDTKGELNTMANHLSKGSNQLPLNLKTKIRYAP